MSDRVAGTRRMLFAFFVRITEDADDTEERRGGAFKSQSRFKK